MERQLAFAVIACASTLVLTWPVAYHFTTRMCGGLGDPQLTLWSMRWLRDALLSGNNPFFTTRLYHPQGTTLVFHTFDLPSAVLMVPLWSVLPEPAIYNTAVLLAFTLTVFGMATLVHDLTNDAVSGALAGVIFAAVPYHYVHLQGHLHLVSMGWIPLYLRHFWRVLDGRVRRGDATLAGVFLGLASLASWYHAMFAALITTVLLLSARPTPRLAQLARSGATLIVAWALLAGPLLVAMVAAKAHEPILGAHDAAVFSADAADFLVPPAAPAETDGEHAAFVGYTTVAMAIVGAFVAPRGRTGIAIALAGASLMLGPELRWRGDVTGWTMPFAWLVDVVPGLAFSGVPVRFGYVMYFGLVLAAGFGLAWIKERMRSAAAGTVLVVALSTLAVAEYWPGPVLTSACPAPAPIRDWARDTERWAVLDVSGGWQQMWHATLHRHPIVGGYLGRVPARLEDWLVHQRLLMAIAAPGGESVTSRREGRVGFEMIQEEGVVGDRLSAEWTGNLVVPISGVYRFTLHATSDAFLEIAGRDVVKIRSSNHDGDSQSGTVRLGAGIRHFHLRVFDALPTGSVDISWAPPGEAMRRIPDEAYVAMDGKPGIDVEYSRRFAADSGLDEEEGRDFLRRLAIRYVVTGDADNACVETELHLPRVFRGDGVRIYEVPPVDD